MKVRRLFVDAETGIAYHPGDTYPGRPERVAQLQASGHLPKSGQPGPTETPTAGPAETKTSTDKGVTASAKPRSSASGKPANRSAARKR